MATHKPDYDPRTEAFGYTCRRCMRCCHGKLIQVNPYEIARLARNRGQSTGEFRAAWTDDGAGNYLRRTVDNACVFLGAEGCTVHADRPLVCRLYPLGRRVTADGAESWSHATPHPQTEGVYSRDGTIAEFIAAQGAEPFMRAADQYVAWVRRAMDLFGAPPRRGGGDAGAGASDNLLDMDAAIAAHCASIGIAEPDDIEARIDLHLEILHRQLDQVEEVTHAGT